MKEISILANEFLNEQFPGDHNQALMELGALVCLPNPKCDDCPLQVSCAAYAAKTQSILPKKQPKKTIKSRFFVFLLQVEKDHIYLEKRVNKDIWKHLYLLPEIELLSQTEFEGEKNKWEKKANWRSGELKHVLTHQHIFSETFLVEKAQTTNTGEWIPFDDLDQIPTPKLFQTIMDLYRR
jgi:A/G-specific adenine glycosylase